MFPLVIMWALYESGYRSFSIRDIKLFYLFLTCVARTQVCAHKLLSNDVNSVIISKLAKWFVAFRLHIVKDVVSSFDNSCSIGKEHYREEECHNRKLNTMLNHTLVAIQLTSLEKILSPNRIMGTTSIKLKNIRIPTPIEPIIMDQFIPSSVATSWL